MDDSAMKLDTKQGIAKYFISFDTRKSGIFLKLPRTFQITLGTRPEQGDCTRLTILASDCDNPSPIKTWGKEAQLLFLWISP